MVLARTCRGFTLIELIAAITIVAVLAAVALPRFDNSTPFSERGYADAVTASARLARAVAQASGCDVQFTIDAAGYRAFQRAANGTHCATAGNFVTPVRRGDGTDLIALAPLDATVTVNQQFVFTPDGRLAGGGAITINIGPQVVTIDPGGWVRGP